MNDYIFYAPYVPENWKIIPNKYVFRPHSKKVGKDFRNYNLLSLTKNGVILKDIESNEGKLPASFEGYQTVERNDLILCLFDLDVSAVFSGLSEYQGMITSAYDVYQVNTQLMMPKFAGYWFANVFSERSYSVYSKSLRHTIAYDSFKNIPIAIPSLEIQSKIVSFLSEKIKTIDSLISNETKQIEKLEEYKKAVITKAVTKGLDPGAKMKDSGVEWIGEIPEGWSVLSLKSQFKFEKGLPITKADLTNAGIKVISYGQIHSKKNCSTEIDNSLFRFVSTDYLKSNPSCLVHKNDLIFADTSEDLEGTGDFVRISEQDTIFAGYHSIILRNVNNLNTKYLSYLFLSDIWRSQLRCRVFGVKLFSVTQKLLNCCTILLPNITEQENIVRLLDSQTKNIRQIIDNKKTKISMLVDYKKSLIYEYVTGKKEC